MLIRYTGPRSVRRLIGNYEWSQETGFVQDVQEAELAANLLMHPFGRFVVDVSEPLLKAVKGDPDRVVAWALEGIATVDDLPRQKQRKKVSKEEADLSGGE